MRQGVLLVAALLCGDALAQVVVKFLGKNGAAGYYSGPCPTGYQPAKAWDATPEAPPTNDELWRQYYKRRQGEADSRYLSGLAGTTRAGKASGHHLRADGAGNRSACDAAKAQRDQVLNSVGLERTYELLQRLDGSVREACK